MDWLYGPTNPSSYSCFIEGFEEQITKFNGEEEETPFLHMLQSLETPSSSFSPSKEPSFQALLRLQHLKKTDDTWGFNGAVGVEASPVKFEAEERDEVEKTPVAAREKRKRKRTRPSKNKEEVECQRMTHIAVERNRRRQMNDHLNVLRSLMPKSYVQRGDQASIVGGAINFVKELEQLVWSLEAQKRIRSSSLSSVSSSSSSSSSSVSSSSSSSLSSMSGVLTPIYEQESYSGAVRAEKKTEAASVEATVIQTHVNLKVECPKTHGRLLRAIVALEELGFTVLHLNIASSLDTALYSFNLKIEDGCELRSADEISKVVHQMFEAIDGIGS